MPIQLKIKKGLDLHLLGAATGSVSQLDAPVTEYAIVPDDFCGLTPKMLKKEGEKIKYGEALFHDKNHTDIVVTSPVSGTITAIERGARRKIEAIRIKADTEQEYASLSEEELSDTKGALLKSGLWAMFRQRPYGTVPSPDDKPRDIFISTFDSSPLSPAHSLLFEGNEEAFKKGVEKLASLTDGKVYVGCREDFALEAPDAETVIVSGPHPAGNAGTQIAAIKPVNKGEVVWTIEPETVVKIGKLFADGYADRSCIVALTGEMLNEPRFVATTEGACLAELLKGNVKDEANARIISGNVLTGQAVGKDGFLRYPYRQVTAIPEVLNDCEMLGWASLSAKKFSASRTFWSWLTPKKKYRFDAKVNGGERAIIMAGEYDKVFPMDIYAEFLIKAIIARDIDKMEQLGIYEVVPEDFALCEFIDTSKLELQRIVREGLDYLRKEMN